MSELNPIPGLLERAADLIETKGWSQGSLWRNGAGDPCEEGQATNYCSAGALRTAAGMAGTMFERKALLSLSRVLGMHPVCWNDSKATGGAQVAAMMRKAAQLERDDPTNFGASNYSDLDDMVMVLPIARASREGEHGYGERSQAFHGNVFVSGMLTLLAAKTAHIQIDDEKPAKIVKVLEDA